jgi:phage repressor protein C with HTH and peptisase S24 domain
MTDDRPEEAQRLQLAREKRGFATAKDATEYFGWNYDTYIQHERGQRGLSRSAQRYADNLRVSRGWLLTGEGKGPDGGVDFVIAKTPVDQGSDVISEGPATIPYPTHLRDVEELGVTVGGDGEDDAIFELNGQIIDRVMRPPGLLNRKNVFALRVANSSMSHRFEEGERIYVEKTDTPAIGDYVVVELKSTEEGRPGKSYLKRLIGREGSVLVTEQFNPRGVLEFSRREIYRIFRVIPLAELMGG